MKTETSTVKRLTTVFVEDLVRTSKSKPVLPAFSCSTMAVAALTTLTYYPTRPQIPAGIKTPPKAFVFASLLADHSNRPFVKFFVDILHFGANIGHCGTRTLSFTPNASSAVIHSDILSTAIAKELELEHTVGPFDDLLFLPFFVQLSRREREEVRRSSHYFEVISACLF